MLGFHAVSFSIDSFVSAVIWKILGVVWSNSSEADAGPTAARLIAFLVVIFMYQLISLAVFRATIGMLAVNARIAPSSSGEGWLTRLSMRSAWFAIVYYYLVVIGVSPTGSVQLPGALVVVVLCWIDVAAMLVDPRRRALHDRLLGTVLGKPASSDARSD